MAINDKNNIRSFTLSVDSCNLKSFFDLTGVEALLSAKDTSCNKVLIRFTFGSTSIKRSL